MNAGMIADLSNIHLNQRREQEQMQVDNSYEPLQPFELPITSCVEQVAEIRLDVRFMSLMDSLAKMQ